MQLPAIKHWSTMLVLFLSLTFALSAGVGTFILVTGTRGTDLAGLLPAGKTVAVAWRLNAESAARWNALVPQPRPQVQADAIAWIETAEGHLGWAALDESEHTVTAVSGPDVQAILDEASPLSQDPVYRSLAKTRPANGTWFFLALGAERAKRLQAPWDEWLRHAKAISLSEQPLSVSWIPDSPPPPMPAAPPLPGSKGSLLAVSVGNAQWLLSSVQPHVEESAILASLLKKSIRELFGDDMSLERDVAPLLSSPIALSIGTTGSGSTGLVLSGADDNQSMLSKRLEELHARFAAEAGNAVVVERVFEDGNFDSTDVRFDPLAVVTKEQEIAGWDVKVTTAKSTKRAFVTAQRGHEYVVATDESMAAQWLDVSPSMPAPAGSTHLVAHGLIAGRKELPAWTQPLIDAIPASLIASRPAEELRWSLETMGGVWTLRME